MTSKSSSSKFGNANLNAVLSKSSSTAPGPGSLGGAKLGYNGMLVLSKVGAASLVSNLDHAWLTIILPTPPQRPRAVSGGKLSVPLPVNLPSIKKVRQLRHAQWSLHSSWAQPDVLVRPV